jgi:hypothetical protein
LHEKTGTFPFSQRDVMRIVPDSLIRRERGKKATTASPGPLC